MERASAARVLLELGQNALEAGARRLVIGLEAGPGGLRLWVLDNGPGFPAPALAGESGFSTARRPGAGQGLALARRACRLRLANTRRGALARARFAPGAEPGDLAGALTALAQHESAPAVLLAARGPGGRGRLAMPVGPGARRALAARRRAHRLLAGAGLEQANEWEQRSCVL